MRAPSFPQVKAKAVGPVLKLFRSSNELTVIRLMLPEGQDISNWGEVTWCHGEISLTECHWGQEHNWKKSGASLTLHLYLPENKFKKGAGEILHSLKTRLLLPASWRWDIKLEISLLRLGVVVLLSLTNSFGR